MSRQRHNPGTRKRRARETAAYDAANTPTPEDYARDLVHRGLASPDILDRRPRPRPHRTEA